MNELIDIIEKMSYELVRGKKEIFVEMVPALNEKLWSVFPKIITSYSYPELRDVSSDATLWPQQLQKVLEVIESNDTFKIIDVLYYETRYMLIEFQNMIQNRNISID